MGNQTDKNTIPPLPPSFLFSLSPTQQKKELTQQEKIRQYGLYAYYPTNLQFRNPILYLLKPPITIKNQNQPQNRLHYQQYQKNEISKNVPYLSQIVSIKNPPNSHSLRASQTYLSSQLQKDDYDYHSSLEYTYSDQIYQDKKHKKHKKHLKSHDQNDGDSNNQESNHDKSTQNDYQHNNNDIHHDNSNQNDYQHNNNDNHHDNSNQIILHNIKGRNHENQENLNGYGSLSNDYSGGFSIINHEGSSNYNKGGFSSSNYEGSNDYNSGGFSSSNYEGSNDQNNGGSQTNDSGGSSCYDNGGSSSSNSSDY